MSSKGSSFNTASGLTPYDGGEALGNPVLVPLRASRSFPTMALPREIPGRLSSRALSRLLLRFWNAHRKPEDIGGNLLQG